MKTMLFVLVVALLGVTQVTTWAAGSTEDLRRADYEVSCLQELIENGGILSGRIYKDNPDGDAWLETESVEFAEYFQDGIAKATIGCKPGRYLSEAYWKNLQGDVLFYSTGREKTDIGLGVQTLTFLMSVNQYRTIRFQIAGVIPMDSDEIWFNGNRAWRDSNGVWQSWVNEPWNAVDTQVQVIWVGHGGWNFSLSRGLMGNVFALDAEDMDERLTSPTELKVVTLLEGSYLDDGLITYNRKLWSSELGCWVLEFISAFDSPITEFILSLNGSSNGSDGERLNYVTVTQKNVSGTFTVPLGKTWIQPQTDIKIVLLDPRTGDYVWRYLGSDLWYDYNERGK